MNKATPEPRCCEICGDPIKRNNSYGICSNPAKHECWNARAQKRREAKPRPEQKYCEVCGEPIRSDNELGICQRPDSPECKAARFRKWREEGPTGRFSFCEVCGRRLRRDNATGVCGTGGSVACAQERDRRRKAGTAPARGTWTPPPYIEAEAVFGRLTVLHDVQGSHDPVLCRCECGNEKRVTRAVYLTSRDTRSCGCIRRELITKHGLSKHPLYATWNGIVQRCTNPNDEHFPIYGGDGVRICERWLDVRTFVEDIEREIGPRPEGVGETGWPLYTIDRIEVEGNYEPGNVRWATSSEQMRNRRKAPEIARQRKALAAEVETLKAALQAVTEQLKAPRKRVVSESSPDMLF